MAKCTDITTGEQTVTATGAITGSLDTSALTGGYTVKLRVRGLASGKKIMIALEDTANSSAFSDAIPVAVFHFSGTGLSPAQPDDNRDRASYDIPSTLFGAANNKLRFNTLRVDSAVSCSVYGWLEQ